MQEDRTGGMSSPSRIEPGEVDRILADELSILGPGRRDDLFGICCSGGGIRSATLNLGILQVLEEEGILEQADYLSTVSGGGYLGSYFLGNRFCGKKVDLQNQSALDHLRRFSNYLAPNKGAFSLDTWTIAMVWLRNTSMLQLFLICCVAAVMLIPRIWAGVAWDFIIQPNILWADPWDASSFVLLAVGVAALCHMLGSSWRDFADQHERCCQGASKAPGTTVLKWMWGVVGLTIVAGGAFTRTLYKVVNDTAQAEMQFAVLFGSALGASAFFLSLFSLGYARGWKLDNFLHRVGFFALLPAGSTLAAWVTWNHEEVWQSIAAVIVWLVVWLVAASRVLIKVEAEENWKDLGRSLIGGLAAAAAAYASLTLAYGLLEGWAVELRLLRMNPGHGFSSGPWHFLIWAIPGLLATLSASLVVMLGAVGRALPDLVREAWSRLAACLLLGCLGLVVVCVFGIYGPLLILHIPGWINGYVAAAGGAGAALTGLAGLMFAQSSETKQGGGAKELLAAVAPFIFILLILTGVSFGLHAVFVKQALAECKPIETATYGVSSCSPFAIHDRFTQPISYTAMPGGGWPPAKILIEQHWSLLSLASRSAPVLPLFFGCIALALFLAWRVDINEFSINPFYRNRLVRCFLGASRYAGPERGAKTCRNPNPVTEFDINDDLQMPLLGAKIRQHVKPRIPIPIVNTAMNMVGAGDAMMAERRAQSFFFTPYYAYSDATGGRRLDDYTLGRRPGDVSLGTLVATSGAAANPNMGFHTSGPVAFLLTFFNVRLGWWAPHPKLGRNDFHFPFSLFYTFRELTATAGDGDALVNLSDGGHFENLGLYELIRRRCRWIIVGDGEQDGSYNFSALGSAIRRCRNDFGVEISIDVSGIRPPKKDEDCPAHFTVGSVHYPDREYEGKILYLKSSFTGKESYDVIQYKRENAAFPHQSTGDQFFDESQFESYRKLGELIARQAVFENGSFFS